MADAVTTQVLHESSDRLIIKCTSISDGTGETGVVKVDVSALSPPATEVAIERIRYATYGMAVRVLWDATADEVAWLIPADADGFIDFTTTFAGRLINNAGSGKTGDVLFTTIGHSAGDTYAIVLEMRKLA